MADFLQTLTVAVTIGSLYALIALGYTMVYGILKLINFAHSDVVVLGAWSSLTVGAFLLPRMGVDLGSPPWWAGAMVLVLSMLLCGGVGFLIERFAYKPLRGAPRLNALITAMGVSLFLQNAGQLQWTAIPATTAVASGTVVDRGSDPKSLLLDTPITIKAGTHYAVRITPTTGTPTERKITAEPGDYAAKQPIAVADAVGRSMVRDGRATFELSTVSTALKLPFGTQPELTPPLLPIVKNAGEANQNVLYQKDFSSTLTLADGSTKEISKPFQITLVDVTIIVCAFALMAALEILVFHTRLGTAMRAVSYNTDFAALMGIPIDRVISFTFVLGATLAAAAGFLYGQKYGQLNPTANYAWTLLGLKAFVAAVVGGIGNVRGAVVGAFLIAVIEQFGPLAAIKIFDWQTASAYTPVAVFALLIVMLLVKPSGLFGSTVREKV
ncbi:MAG: branched-chain amino acid ABC transporter permease [Tepidisphaeraceae bacterium]